MSNLLNWFLGGSASTSSNQSWAPETSRRSNLPYIKSPKVSWLKPNYFVQCAIYLITKSKTEYKVWNKSFFENYNASKIIVSTYFNSVKSNLIAYVIQGTQTHLEATLEGKRYRGQSIFNKAPISGQTWFFFFIEIALKAHILLYVQAFKKITTFCDTNDNKAIEKEFHLSSVQRISFRNKLKTLTETETCNFQKKEMVSFCKKFLELTAFREG